MRGQRLAARRLATRVTLHLFLVIGCSERRVPLTRVSNSTTGAMTRSPQACAQTGPPWLHLLAAVQHGPPRPLGSLVPRLTVMQVP
jgi:hypothetical protein